MLFQEAGSVKLDDDTVAPARRYAFHYFFRRMIPLSSHEAGRDELTLGIRSFDQLLPGHHPGLDAICDGILTGPEFVFDA